MHDVDAEITKILHQIHNGEQDAREVLWSLVYARLRQIAHYKINQNDRPDLLSTTGLVHEAYLKMADMQGNKMENRSHFFAISSRAMRQVLVDKARHRHAKKRAAKQGAVDRDVAAAEPNQRVLDINDALDELAKKNPRMASIVECRFFGGFTNEQVAHVLDVSTKTVEREWQRAKAYLKLALRSEIFPD